MKLSWKYFFSNLEKIHIYLRISSHVPRKSLKINFACAVIELLKTVTHCTLFEMRRFCNDTKQFLWRKYTFID